MGKPPLSFKIVLPAAFWAVLLSPFFLSAPEAAPRIIRDNRLELLHGFPSVGRGYTVYSNTLQSMCFKEVQHTSPVFNLDYDMEDITEGYVRNLKHSARNRYRNAHVYKFLEKFKDDVENRAPEHNVKSVHQLKNIIVRAEVFSYYYSLDETRSHLSDSVQTLLSKRQFVTFFNSCGYHYIRSIGSYSSYLALLQYRLTGDEHKDKAFREGLERGLFSFNQGPVGPGGPRKSDQADVQLERESEQRSLRIYVEAVGLSKGKQVVNLIPVNIEQFRQAVQEAVKLMEHNNAGVVTSIEVVPWIENPEFNVYVSKYTEAKDKALKEEREKRAEEKQKDTGDTSKKSKDSEETKGTDTSDDFEDDDIKTLQTESQFLRQARLELNSSIITGIQSVSESNIELYNIAAICENVLQRDFLALSEGLEGQAEQDATYPLDRTCFNNLQNESDYKTRISLRQFLAHFEKYSPRTILELNGYYLQGIRKSSFSQKKTVKREWGGALKCIAALYREGLDRADFSDLKECSEVLDFDHSHKDVFRQIQYIEGFLRRYCMPRVANVIPLSEIKTDSSLKVNQCRVKPEGYVPPNTREKDKGRGEAFNRTENHERTGEKSGEKSDEESKKDPGRRIPPGVRPEQTDMESWLKDLLRIP